MSLIANVITKLERVPLPDRITSAGIDYLVSQSRRRLTNVPITAEAEFLREMQRYPIASHTELANAQHYEVPAAFFEQFLGPRRKYSCCYYPDAATTLAEAETLALAETVARADVLDGQSILELGCGWGAVSLYLAERFPNAKITAVSNSQSQRAFITSQAASRQLSNLAVTTANMNDFAPTGRFDRIISVEMFEHMANWQALLGNVHGWLNPGGRLFLHVFTHRNRSYRFDHADPADWIAQHFFTGGIMPAHDLVHRFPELFKVEAEWRWSGANYSRTAMDWLANYDAHSDQVGRILDAVYGPDAKLWRRRWRLFFLATASLFGHSQGQEWGIGHYRLAPAGAPQ